MKIVRESLNEIKRGDDVRSSIGVGKRAHLREFFNLIDEYPFLKVSPGTAKGWRGANESIAKKLSCGVKDLRFTNFYHEDLWKKMEDWFGPSDDVIEIFHRNTPNVIINGRVWTNLSLVVFKMKDLVMGGKTYYQIYTSEIGMNSMMEEMKRMSINH
jgi:hypothetical protein